MANALGEKIRRLRKEKQLTLDGLAEATGSSKSYIWELENKNPPRPSAEKVARIAEALGVTNDFLVNETSQTLSARDHEQVFFRNYRQLEPDEQAKLRGIAELWAKKT